MSWTTVATLDLEDALAYAGRSLGTERRDIQGQRVIELVAWQLAVPVAHALLDGRPPPRLTHVWIGDDAPDPTPDGAHESLDAWREYTRTQLTPLVYAINSATRRPCAGLWRGVDDRVAGAMVWIAQTTGREDQAQQLAERVTDDPEVRLFNGAVLHVRHGCCLYYRIPGTIKCWGCPLLTDDERRALSS